MAFSNAMIAAIYPRPPAVPPPPVVTPNLSALVYVYQGSMPPPLQMPGDEGIYSAYMLVYVASKPSKSSQRLNIGLFVPATFWCRYFATGRGLYRIFNAAEYRFYRSNSAPPAESDSPFATNSTLPHTPVDTYADGTWYLSVSYFNGVIDSGFLPLGPNGETYLRLDLVSAVSIGSPPNGPIDWRIQAVAGGVVRVNAFYYQGDALRAEQWALAYTTDGSTPPADTPDVTVVMPTRGVAGLAYDLPAQSHGTTVKVRLQTRREDASWIYSENSAVLTVSADATGPAAPPAGDRWAGSLAEDV